MVHALGTASRRASNPRTISPGQTFRSGDLFSFCSRTSNSCRIVQTSALKARWRFDVRFGRKREAVQLLQEWVRDVGSQAGLTASNTGITTGAVGAPESRLELEVEVANMAELESFWARIPVEKHTSWVRIVQDMIVDGSPTWEVYRTVAVDLDLPAGAQGSSAATATASSGTLEIVDDGDLAELILSGSNGDGVDSSSSRGGPRMPDGLRTTDSGLSVVESLSDADEVLGWAPEPPPPSRRGTSKSGGSQVQLDWKGEPMEINPGDKIPRIQ
mmetsp:Transcript_19768/g.54909  ORF Transcript_19768/g.54909 Transcript_19768/m.54909 type:complete len:273 (-) Transcript_19768:41-859(-)|eukprot:CAMPEP_0117677576 /NCGR_PEP_ID=MMETSP0804-20121206/16819_1 /TAXON_ID=1074897 /ORGANISM="Tetraselmis astigmatica, Strain CCMP880" /LENGTH=272 /DNA_ID=CAMNT_0005486869 /DNA_START=159 /DNA_END=977 /DNA_ORIENTATION=+